jgi:type II secretory pathway component PulF
MAEDKFKKIMDYDLLQMPLIKSIIDSTVHIYRGFPRITTSRHRNKCAGLLFREMAVCVRRGYPLPEALEKISTGTTRMNPVHLVGRLHSIFFLVMISITFAVLISCNIKINTAGKITLLLIILYTPFYFVPRFHDAFLKYLANGLSAELKKGKKLCEAMESIREAFLPHEIALIKTGEESGKLNQALDKAAHYNSLSEKIPRTPWLALYIIYPGIILLSLFCGSYDFLFHRFKIISPDNSFFIFKILYFLYSSPAGFFIVMFAFLFVVYLIVHDSIELFFLSGWLPGTIFITACVSLPACISMFYILHLFESGIYEGFSRIIHIIIIMSLILISVYAAKKKRTGYRCSYAQYIINLIPVVKNMLNSLYYSRFLYTLSALLQSGAPLHEAVEYAGKSSGHKRTFKESEKVSGDLCKGKSLSDALISSSLLSQGLRRQILLGEKANCLALVCQDLSEELLEDFSIKSEKARTQLRIIFSLCFAFVVFSVYAFYTNTGFLMNLYINTYTD